MFAPKALEPDAEYFFADEDCFQALFRFPNDYGLSAVKAKTSLGGDQGLWEVCMVRFSGPDINSYSLVEDNKILQGVIGFLNEYDISVIAERVSNLHQPTVLS